MNTQIPSARWSATWCCLWLAPILAAGLGSAAHADQIDDVVTAQLARQHIPGVSIALLKDGKVVKVKGYGLANVELGTPATADTVYQIGSASKQFIAAGIVMLAREGRLGLDDALGRFIEDAPAAWRSITVRQLLTHTSGLAREVPGNELKVQSDIDAIRAGYPLPLVGKPGEKMEYSNLGYFTLAEIITRSAGKPWPQYINERIFTPLGMKSTRTTTSQELVRNRSGGYVWADPVHHNAIEVPNVRPSGAFLSTVNDLARWDAALNSDALFTARERELMWAPVRLNDGSTQPYGFGWRIGSVGTHRQIHHAGSMPGYRAQISRFADDGISVIVLTNTGQASPERIGTRLASLYIPDLQPTRKAAKMSVEELDTYTGRYEFKNGAVVVARRGDQLTLTTDMGARRMEMAVIRPEDRIRFFDEDNPRSTFFFEPDAQGRLQLVLRDEAGKEGVRGARAESGKSNN
jgi:CubicO group peptidase (beta-lactamase class C family)